jgi:hypothetical protein
LRACRRAAELLRCARNDAPQQIVMPRVCH